MATPSTTPADRLTELLNLLPRIHEEVIALNAKLELLTAPRSHYDDLTDLEVCK